MTLIFDNEQVYNNFIKIKEAAKEVLREKSLSKKMFNGVNECGLSVRDVYLTYHMDGDIEYNVLIEECSPTAYEFRKYMIEGLKDKLGFYVNVECEW